MSKLTKREELLVLLGECIENKVGITLGIVNEDYPKAEEIWNPHENLKYKAEYIFNAYTEDLVLKSSDKIKIDFYFEDLV